MQRGGGVGSHCARARVLEAIICEGGGGIGFADRNGHFSAQS